jgi:hypothetical protein
VTVSLTLFYSKNCHSRNFGTRDLRQANLPHAAVGLSLSPTRAAGTAPSSPQGRVASPPLASSKSSPPPSALGRPSPLFASATVGRKDAGALGDAPTSPGPLLRPTRVLSPTRGAFSTDSEQTDSTDNTTDQGSDDSHFTPSHAGRSEGGLPRTVPLTGTPDRVPPPLPSAQPPYRTGSPATLGRANTLGGNGATVCVGLHRWLPAPPAHVTARRSWVICVPLPLVAQCGSGVVDHRSAHVVTRTCILQSR